MLLGETTTVSHIELADYARQLVVLLSDSVTSSGATVVTLTGNLGAGKTTFVQHLALELGVTEVVTSPTFVVMKKYETTNPVFTTLVHIDAYRIETVSEMNPLRFDEILREPHTLICIEWAERIASLLPSPVHHISISTIDEVTRAFTYEKRY